jgi:class 3 adenylate cyclase/tetratricopeptide (TPR) repeat protein
MFCDISGFTAMSERLAEIGKEGAELMAGVLNRFFDRMLAIADEWGGVQMKFGGDAMLLYFSDQGHADRAAAAGLDMQAAMAGFRRVTVAGNDYRLRMRIAIHSGRFFGASVGQPQGLLHYLLAGPDVNRTAEIEGSGQPGQVVLSREAASQVEAESRLVQRNGVFQIRSLKRPPYPPPKHYPLASGNTLKQYILPPLSAPLLQGQVARGSGEHRRVTAVFINLLGISTLLQTEGDAQALAQADAYVKMVIGAVERHGGFLAASDLAQDGDKLICLFGAPVSVEREERAALLAVTELDRDLRASDLSLRHRIGVSSGFVFAGEIGSSRRREYTVIGDSVNLAARLMAAARPDEVLVSMATIDRAGAGFDAQRLRPIRLKGKAAPVPVFRLRDNHLQHAVPHELEALPLLVGRERELNALLRLAGSVSSTGRGRWTYVWGAPGIGKSRLTQELASRLHGQGWQRVTVSCALHTWHTPLAPWREPLRALIGVSSDDEPERAWIKLSNVVDAAAPELSPFAPLLAELLSIPIPDEATFPWSDPKDRRRQLVSVVAALLDASARQGPLMLLFEDAHWADTVSLELLAAVVAKRSRIAVVITSREPSPPGDGPDTTALRLHLEELSAEAARSMLSSELPLTEEVLERIVARAQGNPLFLHEIARSGIRADESLPETVNDVILARLDRLPFSEKMVLRMASVIGPSFSSDELNAVASEAGGVGSVGDALAALGGLGFTHQVEAEVPVYEFAHALTREVAYETLPFAERRRFHRRVARHIEERDAAHLGGSSELLLYHYEVVADTAKIVRYAAMSGDRAASIFAMDDAKTFYRRALAQLSGDDKRAAPDRSVLYERLGDCLLTTAEHKEAQDSFELAIREWRLRPPRPRGITVTFRPRTREGDLCRKVAISLERRSEYDHALGWLDNALRALPEGSARSTAQIYTVKSLAFYRKGLYDQALHWGRLGLKLSRRGGDLRELAYAHTIVANTYTELGRLRQALRHDRIAVRYYHEMNDLPGQALANGNVAVSYQMMGVLDGAKYHYELGLKADERLGDTSHGAIMHNNIAEVLLMMGQIDEASAHLEKVISAYRNERGLAGLAGLAHVNQSRCLLRRGEVHKAASQLRRGMRLLRSAGVVGVLCEAQLQQAELHLATGNIKQSRRLCRRALLQIRAQDAKVLEARAERLLGKAEAALGDLSRARTHFQASITIASRTGAGYEEALSLRELGGVLHAGSAAGRQASKTMERAARILTKMGASVDPADPAARGPVDSAAPIGNL